MTKQQEEKQQQEEQQQPDSQESQEEKKTEDVDVDSLSEEELAELEAEEPSDQEPEPEKENDSPADAETNESSEDPEPESSPEQKRLKDAQRKMHEAIQAKKDLEEKFEKAQAELNKLKLGEFKELSAEALADLKYSDPDAYVDYLVKKQEFEAQKTAFEQQEQQLAAQKVIAQQELVLVDFIKQTFDVEIDLSKPLVEQPEDVQALLQTGKLEKIDKYVMDNFKAGEDGLFTVEQLQAANTVLFKDEIVQKERIDTRTQTINDIEKAANGGSQLDKLPSGSGGQPPRSIDDYSQDEIDSMPEDMVNQLLKELD